MKLKIKSLIENYLWKAMSSQLITLFNSNFNQF